MDMLDIESNALYFEEPLHEEAQQCLNRAADHYGDENVEPVLMRAYLLEPEHPMVLVALYRFFYYQHRLADALIIAERVLQLFARRLDLPADWRALRDADLGDDRAARMGSLRFYLLALKGAGFLELRLGHSQNAISRLQKVAELDVQDRLGARALLEVAEAALHTNE